jgi:ribosomal protein S18 acetylase RimI-like enzyme
MHLIDYRDSTDGITPAMLRGFFREWKKPPDPETHLQILRGSDFVILALDNEAHKVVGFVTAITDHVQAAFIPLLEVLPEYQRRGVGTELMRRILQKLESVPAIDLTCDASMQGFYNRLGMCPSTGMIIRNY